MIKKEVAEILAKYRRENHKAFPDNPEVVEAKQAAEIDQMYKKWFLDIVETAMKDRWVPNELIEIRRKLEG